MPYVTQPDPTPRPQTEKKDQNTGTAARPDPKKPIFSDWAMI